MKTCHETVSIAHILQEGGTVAVTVSGYSMYPMLKNRRDCVVCEKYRGDGRKYDVLLYKTDGKLVLHRVIKKHKKDGNFIIRGDNCLRKEYVPEKNVIGILTEFTRKGKDCTVKSKGYRLYSFLIVLFHPVVALKIKTKAALSALKTRLLGRQ